MSEPTLKNLNNQSLIPEMVVADDKPEFQGMAMQDIPLAYTTVVTSMAGGQRAYHGMPQDLELLRQFYNTDNQTVERELRAKFTAHGCVSPESQELWKILDDIDTMSDALKPSTAEGYKRFYEEVMKRIQGRFNVHSSDGYQLYPRGIVPPDANCAPRSFYNPDGRTPHEGEPTECSDAVNDHVK